MKTIVRGLAQGAIAAGLVLAATVGSAERLTPTPLEISNRLKAIEAINVTSEKAPVQNEATEDAKVLAILAEAEAVSEEGADGQDDEAVRESD